MPDLHDRTSGTRWTVGFWTSRPESDGTYIVVNEYGKRLSVNSTGMEILQYLTDGFSESEAVARLMDEYDIGVQQAEESVSWVVGQLQIAGMLHA